MRCLKSILIVVLLGSLLVSCRRRGTTLYVMMNRVDGLYKSSLVMYKGVEVGEVRQMKLLGDSVLLTIRVKRGLNIPQGSRFVLNSPVIGQTCINIEPSKGLIWLQAGDTARGTYEARQLIENAWTDSAWSSRTRQAMRQIIEGILMLADTTGKNSSSGMK